MHQLKQIIHKEKEEYEELVNERVENMKQLREMEIVLERSKEATLQNEK